MTTGDTLFLTNKLQIKWFSKVAIFPREWFSGQSLLNYKLREKVYQIGWGQSQSLREYSIDDPNIRKALMGNIKNKSYVGLLSYGILRHLVRISYGDIPVLIPSHKEKALKGPFNDIQAFLIDLNLKMLSKKRIYPTILQPTHLLSSDDMGFYTLNPPSILGYFPECFKTRKSLVHNIENILRAIHDDYPDILGNLDIKNMYFFYHNKIQRKIQGKKIEEDFIPKKKIHNHTLFFTHKFLRAFIKIVKK